MARGPSNLIAYVRIREDVPFWKQRPEVIAALVGASVPGVYTVQKGKPVGGRMIASTIETTGSKFESLFTTALSNGTTSSRGAIRSQAPTGWPMDWESGIHMGYEPEPNPKSLDTESVVLNINDVYYLSEDGNVWIANKDVRGNLQLGTLLRIRFGLVMSDLKDATFRVNDKIAKRLKESNDNS